MSLVVVREVQEPERDCHDVFIVVWYCHGTLDRMHQV